MLLTSWLQKLVGDRAQRRTVRKLRSRRDFVDLYLTRLEQRIVLNAAPIDTLDDPILSVQDLGGITIDAGEQADDGEADTFRVTRDGDDTQVYVNDRLVYSNRLDNSSRLGGLPELNLLGSGDDDTLIVDFSNGNPIGDGGLRFDGGDAVTGDSMILTGGSADTVLHTFDNTGDGRVQVDGTLIAHSNVEPITDLLAADDRLFDFTGGSEQITLSDVGGGDSSKIETSLGASLIFANPADSLTVTTGGDNDGSDTITIAGIDEQFDADVSILGDADDVVSVSGDVDAGTGDVSITAESIYVEETITTDAATVALNATDEITISSTGGIDNAQGQVYVDAGAEGTLLVGGTVRVAGETAGTIHLLGDRVGLIDDALVDASGINGGGTVLVGGDYQGANAAIRNAAFAYLGPDATILADSLGNGDGGTVILWADEVTQFYGTISVMGGPLGGNGGFVETSGKDFLEIIGAHVNASAPLGDGGAWLLDPRNITIAAADNNRSDAGVNPRVFTPTGGASTVDATLIRNILQMDTDVTVTTIGTGTGGDGDITVAASIVVDFSADAGPDADDTATLTLNSADDIVVNTGQSISATNGTLNIVFNAEDDITFTGNVSASGSGTLNITADSDNNGNGMIGGTGTISAGSGLVTLRAADQIIVNTNVSTIDVRNGNFDGKGGGADGVISITETDAINVTAVNDSSSANGSITVVAGGAVTATNIFTSDGDDNDDIAVTGTSIIVSTIVAQNNADVTLTATAGNITGTGGNLITANRLSLNANSAGASIGTLVNPILVTLGAGGQRLSASANTGSGGIFVSETDNTTAGTINAATGDVVITPGGTFSTTDSLDITGGNITIQLTADQQLDVDNNTSITASGNVTLIADRMELNSAGGDLISTGATNTILIRAAENNTELRIGGTSGDQNGRLVLDNTDLAALSLPANGTLQFGADTFRGTTSIRGNVNRNLGSTNLVIFATSLDFQNTNDAITTTGNVTVNVAGGGDITDGGGDDVTDVTAAEIFLNVTNGSTVAVDKSTTTGVTVNIASGSATLDGRFTGTGGLTKTGTGTLVVSNTNNNYGGATAINDGTLQLGAAGVIPDGSAVTVAGGATFDLGSFNETIGSLAGISGTASVTLGNATLTTGGDNGTTVFAGAIIGLGGNLVKEGTGTFTLSGNNIYTGTTSVNDGILNAANADALGSTAGGTTVAGGATLNINGVTIGAEAVTLNGTGVGANGALTGDGTAELQGTVALATASSVGVAAVADTLTLSGIIGGGNDLTKVGGGTVILSGLNTYTGDTTILAGTLAAGAAAPLGANGAFGNSTNAILLGDTAGAADATVAINGAFTVARNIDVRAGSTGTSALAGIAGSSMFTGTVTLIKDVTLSASAGATTEVAGQVTGGFNVTKAGDGTVVLSNGTNDYTGSTTVNAGTLSVTNADALGTTGSGTTVNTGGTLSLNGVDIVAAEALTLAGGTLTGTGNRTIDSAVTLMMGTTSFINVAGADTFEVTNPIVEDAASAALNKIGTGTLRLNGINTYTGTTNVGQGTLEGNTTIGGDLMVNNGGTLSPGDSSGTGIGTFTVMGNVTFQSNLATLTVQLNGTTPGTTVNDHDVLSFTGTAALNNATLSQTIGFTPAAGDEVVFLETAAGTITGEFNGLSAGSIVFTGPPAGAILYNGLGTGNDGGLLFDSGAPLMVPGGNAGGADSFTIQRQGGLIQVFDAAAPVIITNAGFEDVSGQTVFNEFTFGTPVGWTLFDPNTVIPVIGTLEPNGTDFFNTTAPEGVKVSILFNSFASGTAGAGEYSYVQTLTDTLQADTVYELSVEVGNIASGTAQNLVFFNLDGFPGYRVELLAGGVVLASDINSLVIPEGEFATSTVSFSTGAAPAQLGQNLGIRLVNLNVIDSASMMSSVADLEVDFDDVRLTASTIVATDVIGFGNDIMIMGEDDQDDTLTVNLSSGTTSDFFNDYTGTITFAGDSGMAGDTGNDSLIINGTNTVDTINYGFINGTDGFVDIDAAGTGIGTATDFTIFYSGLDPISQTVTANNVLLNYSNASETITVSAMGTQTRVDSTLGEMVTFNNPLLSTTINAGDDTGGDAGIDIITVNGFGTGGANEFRSSLTLNAGDEANDRVDIRSDITLGSTTVGNLGNLTVMADAINVGTFATPRAIDTVAATTNAGTGGIGNVAFTAQRNILINSMSSIRTGDGTITLTALGSTALNIDGIRLNSNSTIETGSGGNAGGMITLTGTGGGGAFASRGVRLEPGSTVRSIGTGVAAINITGTGGASSAFANTGVLLNGGDVTSANGDITIDGTGGGTAASGGINFGVQIASSANVSAAGTGAVQITGMAGAGPSFNSGVFITGAGTTVTAAAGGLTIMGTGTSDGTAGSTLNEGVQIDASAMVSTTFTGTLRITGTGGAGLTDSRGVLIEDAGTNVTAADGNILITGSSSPGTGNDGIDIGNPVVVQTTGTGDITITTDSLVIDATATISAVGDIVTVQNLTLNRAIDLGTETAGQLSLTDAELDRITAGTLRVGRNDAFASGAINVSAAITPGGTTVLRLLTGGSVVDAAAGSIVETNLAVSAGGAITLNNAATHDVAMFAANSTGGFVFYRDSNSFSVGTVDGVSGVNSGSTVTLVADAGDITVTNNVVSSTTINLLAFAANAGINISAGVSLASSNGSHFYNADNLDIDSTATINAGAQAVIIRQFTAGTLINVGDTGANAADGTLRISDAELDRITAGVIRIGNSASGAMTITNTIDPAMTNTLRLQSGSTVSDGATGAIQVTNLAVVAGGAVTLDNAANDVDVLAINSTTGNISFRDSDGFSVGTVDFINGVDTNAGSITLVADTGNITVTNTGIALDIASTTGISISALAADAEIIVASGAIISDTGGNHIYTADNMDIQGSIAAAGRTVTLRNRTLNNAIDFSATASAADNILRISDAEIDNVTANVIRVGRNDAARATGTITVSQTVDSLMTTILHLITGIDVMDGLLGAIVETALAVEAGGNVLLDNTGNNVTTLAISTTAGNVSYRDSDGFSVGTVDGVTGISTGGGSVTLDTTNGDITISNTAAANDISATTTIDITADAADAAINISAGAVSSSTGGTHTYSADNMDIRGTINGSGQRVVLRPTTNNTAIDLGSAGANAADVTLRLSSAELNNVTAGILEVGFPLAGAVSITAAIAPAGTDTLRITGGSTVTDIGLGSIVETNLVVDTTSDVILDHTLNDWTTVAVDATGDPLPATSTVTLIDSAGGLQVGMVDGISGVTTEAGPISITANGGLLDIVQVVSNTGNNDISLSGAGVNLSTMNSDVMSGSGAVMINAGAGAFTMAAGSSVVTTLNNISVSAVGASLAGVVQTTGVMGGLGSITFDATTGTFTMLAGSSVMTTNNNIMVSANDVDLAGLIRTTGMGSEVRLVSDLPTAAINLGATAADGAGVFALTDVELNTIEAPIVRIGDATTTGTVTFVGNFASLATFATNFLELRTTNMVTATAGAVNLVTSGTDLAVRSGNVVNLDNAGHNFDVVAVTTGGTASAVTIRDGVDAMTIGTVDSVTPLNGITTGDANITVTAAGLLSINQNVTNTGAPSISLTGTGLNLAAAATVNSGAGTILIDGTAAAIDLTTGTLTTTNGTSSAVTIQDASTVTLGNITAATAGAAVNIGAAGQTVTGAVTQTAATALNVTGLAVTTGGPVTLMNPANLIRNMAVQATGMNDDVNIVSDTSSTITSVGAAPVVGIDTNRGDVTVTVTTGTLFVNSVIDTAPGGSGTLTVNTGVVVNVAPVVGAGDITLTGATPDVIIAADQVSPSTISILAQRDIIIRALLRTTMPATDINLTADGDNNGVGGVWIQDGPSFGFAIGFVGMLDSAGDVLIEGSDVFNTIPTGVMLDPSESEQRNVPIDEAIDSVRTDAGTPGTTINAAGTVIIRPTGAAPVNADVVINGAVNSVGTQTITANDDVRLTGQLMTTGAAANIVVNAGRDILAGGAMANTGTITTQMADADVTLTADNFIPGDPPGDGFGGVFLGTNGFVNSGRDVLMIGSDVTATAAVVDSVQIESDGTNNQVTAAGDITITRTTAAPMDADQIIDGRINSTGGGAVAITAREDIRMGIDGDILAPSGGSIVLTAAADGTNGGQIVMADGAVIDANAGTGGTISLIADGDITLGQLTTNNDTAAAVSVNTAGGAVIDGGNTGGEDIIADSANALVTIDAHNGVGSGNPIETRAATIDVDNTSSGNIELFETNNINVQQLDNDTPADNNAATGTVSLVTSAGSITVLGSGSGVTAFDGNVTLNANGTNSDIAVNAQIMTTNMGAVNILADDSVTFGIDGDVTASGSGNVTVLANETSVSNGGFETGNLSGWATVGSVSVQTAAFNSGPTEGTFQALLSTAGTATASAIETFLGLAAGSLNGLGNGTATAGSAIRQTVTAAAGETLSFDFNFLTDESTPSFFNDFGFVSITGAVFSELADTNSVFGPSLTVFGEETGFGTFPHTFTSSGTFTVGIGVVDVGDTGVDSGLLVDNLLVDNVGVPSAGGNVITMTDGSVIDAGSGTVELSAPGPLGGNISLGQLVTTNNSASAVRVATDSGAIIDNGDTGGADIMADAVGAVTTLSAVVGIGSTGEIDTTVRTLDATNTGSGNVDIAETGAIVLSNVEALDGSVNVTANGALTATFVTALGSGNDVSLATTIGGMTLDTVVADDNVTATADIGGISVNNVNAQNTATITASTGSIQELGADATADVVAGTINLNAEANIGADTINRLEIDARMLLNAIANGAGGTGIFLDDRASGVTVGLIDAGPKTAALSATADIRSASQDDTADIIAANVDLDAVSGIGSTGALDITATTISANNTSIGPIDIDSLSTASTGTVTASSLTTRTGFIRFDQTGPQDLNVDGVMAGNGSITITNTANIGLGSLMAVGNTVSVNAAAAITDINVNSNNVTAQSLQLIAGSNVGAGTIRPASATFAAAQQIPVIGASELNTSVSTLAVQAGGDIDVSNIGALTIGGVGSTNGVTAMGGDVKITTFSPLLVAAPVTSSGGSIRLHAAITDSLTVAAPVRVSSGSGDIALIAANNVNLFNTGAAEDVSLPDGSSGVIQVVAGGNVNFADSTGGTVVLASGSGAVGNARPSIIVDPTSMDFISATQLSDSGFTTVSGRFGTLGDDNVQVTVFWNDRTASTQVFKIGTTVTPGGPVLTAIPASFALTHQYTTNPSIGSGSAPIPIFVTVTRDPNILIFDGIQLPEIFGRLGEPRSDGQDPFVSVDSLGPNTRQFDAFDGSIPLDNFFFEAIDARTDPMTFFSRESNNGNTAQAMTVLTFSSIPGTGISLGVVQEERGGTVFVPFIPPPPENVEIIVTPPAVQTEQIRRASTAEPTGDLREVKLIIYDPNGKELDRVTLKEDVLDELTAFFQKLPDGHYQITIRDAGEQTEQTVIDIQIKDGKVSRRSTFQQPIPEGENDQSAVETEGENQRISQVDRIWERWAAPRSGMFLSDASRPAGSGQWTDGDDDTYRGGAAAPFESGGTGKTRSGVTETASRLEHPLIGASLMLGSSMVLNSTRGRRDERVDETMEKLSRRSVRPSARLRRFFRK